MFIYLLRRLGVFVPTLVGVSLLAFLLIRMVPGDPILVLFGERGASPEVYEEAKRNLGLDKPLPVQYFYFIKNALQGNLGTSVLTKEPVFKEFITRFPATVELSIFAMLFAILLGIPTGVFAAIKRNSPFDYGVMGLSLVGYSMPIFWWGLILVLIFSVHLGWTPVSGRIGLEHDVPFVTGFLMFDSWYVGTQTFLDALRHMILPSIVLGTIPLAVISRMTRSSLLEVIGEDYIRTARAKGLSFWKTIIIHALRNALIPVVTVIGLMFGTLVTGAILTETIFSWPGIGKWLVLSVTQRDYPVIQGGILLISLAIILVNICVDLLYVLVDPRLRDHS